MSELIWDKIMDKPSTFVPDSHLHSFDSIANKPNLYKSFDVIRGSDYTCFQYSNGVKEIFFDRMLTFNYENTQAGLKLYSVISVSIPMVNQFKDVLLVDVIIDANGPDGVFSGVFVNANNALHVYAFFPNGLTIQKRVHFKVTAL